MILTFTHHDVRFAFSYVVSYDSSDFSFIGAEGHVEGRISTSPIIYTDLSELPIVIRSKVESHLCQLRQKQNASPDTNKR